MITQKYLHEFFHYDPLTGEFTRKKKTGTSTKIGERVGSEKGNGYLMLCLKSRLYLAHRVAWMYVYGVWPEKNLDHINGVPSDNRIANLREASQSQNTANSHLSKANRSGYKGVTWAKGAQRWKAAIMVNYRHKHLGYFDCKQEAALAYKKAATEHFGAFAKTQEYTKRQELKNL